MDTPSESNVARGLVAVYLRAGPDESALGKLDATLRRIGASAPLWLEVANGLLAAGAVAAAGTLLRSALQSHPDDPGLRCRLADSLRAQSRYAESEHELRTALTAHPRHPALAKSLAFLLREQGRYRAAVEAVSTHWPDGPHAQDAGAKATFLAQCGEPAAALQVCRRALTHGEDARLLQLSGQLAATVGEFDCAASALRRATRLDPQQASAWLWLALVHPFRARSDPDLRGLESAREGAPVGSEVRIAAGFALGKAWDDLDDIRAAVRVLREANAAVSAREHWNARQWNRFVDRQVSMPAPAPVPDMPVTPVFVTGMPRTGTTLIATLLARHPQVRNRGETGWLASIAAQAAPHGYPEDFLRRAARLYAVQLRQDDEPAQFYVDKNPSNLWHLGLAAALFSGARVIHCQRDPRDTALSIWRQRFAGTEAGFAYRLEDIACVMRDQARLLEHWRATLQVPILELQYEDLVAHPDETVAAVLRFLGFDDPAATGDRPPHAVPIGTASVWQARQSIHTRSVGRWQRYVRWLPELAAIPDG